MPTSSPSPPSPPSAQAGLLLTEVLFAPVAGEFAFVEISNTGSTAIDLAGAILRLDEMHLSLGGLAEPLAPEEQLLVLLDKQHATEGKVIHGSDGFALAADTGAVELLDSEGRRLDRVAWGDGQPAGVLLAAGALVPDVLDPGTTIGRAPGATQPGQPYDWVVYAAADASPGRQNPMPTVGVLLPLSGVVLDETQASLAWYPVPGAVAYRVQVASDPTFASTLIDTTTTEPQVDSGPLAPGEYSWRVLAQAADGTASRFSGPSTFELRSATAGAAIAGTGDAILAADEPGKQLAVPLLSQHKDTSMLLLERNVERGAHAWDVDHGVLDPGDPADNKNCAIASVTMVNHFFGGDLSQDRIGYELFKDRQAGPERDLPHGSGIDQDQVTRALSFALGAAPTHLETGRSPDEVWAAVTTSIDARRPVVAAGLQHVVVFTGYEVKGGKRLFSMNDPWNYPGRSGTSRYNIDANNGKSAAVLDLWLPPAGAVGRHEEPSIRTDSDGDGVVDFDESERFRTNPNAADSDGDKVRDKQDITSGIFDPTYGYARDPLSESAGRDFDSDGMPTERDPDSDQGGCQDGEEDKNLDGHQASPETSNFDASDDKCHKGAYGSIVYTRTSSYDSPTLTQSAAETLTVNVRLKNAGPTDVPGFVDDGSTFSYRSTSTGVLRAAVPGFCDITFVSAASGGGSVADADGLVVGGLSPAEDGFVVSVSVPVDEEDTTDYCVFVETSTPQAHASTPDGCVAPVMDAKAPIRVFVFACEETFDGGSWRITGTITVP